MWILSKECMKYNYRLACPNPMPYVAYEKLALMGSNPAAVA